MGGLLLNLTIANFAFQNILGSPFLSFTQNTKLSLFDFRISRFDQPFVYHINGQANFSKGIIQKSLNTAITIGNHFRTPNSECPQTEFANGGYYVFDSLILTDCGSFVQSHATNYIVRIHCCQIVQRARPLNYLIDLLNNYQIDITSSTFTDISTNSYGIIKSYSGNHNYYSSFSMSNSLLTGSNPKSYSDAIYSYSHFHNIYNINCTDLTSSSSSNSVFFNLECGEMTKFSFVFFTKLNYFSKLINFQNLPTSQSIANLGFFNCDSTYFIASDQPCQLSNCRFSHSDYLDHFLVSGNGKFIFASPAVTLNPGTLINTKCSALFPAQTPLPPSATFTPTGWIPNATATATQSPSASATRSLWPTRSPLPSVTPTAPPPFGLIVGISIVGAFVLTIIIVCIIMIVKGVKDKSSEDSVENRRHERRSGDEDFSFSSDDTDVLELNSSSVDSFEF